MSIDYKAAERQRQKLKTVAAEAKKVAPWIQDDDLEILLNRFLIVTPPRETEEIDESSHARSSGRPDISTWVTVFPVNVARSRTVKPGNIVLNWTRLIDVVPDVGMAGFSAASNPAWGLPLAALYIANKFAKSAVESLSDVEATVILALWTNKGYGLKIAESAGFVASNAQRAADGLPPLNLTEYTNAVTKLARLKCIKIENAIIEMIEHVGVKYES